MVQHNIKIFRITLKRIHTYSQLKQNSCHTCHKNNTNTIISLDSMIINTTEIVVLRITTESRSQHQNKHRSSDDCCCHVSVALLAHAQTDTRTVYLIKALPVISIIWIQVPNGFMIKTNRLTRVVEPHVAASYTPQRRRTVKN